MRRYTIQCHPEQSHTCAARSAGEGLPSIRAKRLKCLEILRSLALTHTDPASLRENDMMFPRLDTPNN